MIDQIQPLADLVKSLFIISEIIHIAGQTTAKVVQQILQLHQFLIQPGKSVVKLCHTSQIPDSSSHLFTRSAFITGQLMDPGENLHNLLSMGHTGICLLQFFILSRY